MLEPKVKPLDRERFLFVLMVATCLLSSAAAVITAWVALRVSNHLSEIAAQPRCPQAAPAPHAKATPKPAASAQPVASQETETVGQSVGSPGSGALLGGKKLVASEGFVLRNDRASYGTDATIAHLQKVIARVRSEHRRLHPLVVGDLSTELGGRLLGHFSHQSGRDVDLGFFYRRRPPGYPEKFVEADRENLNFRATWALIEALADTADTPGGVEWILLDYDVQRLIYNWARRGQIDHEKLERIFQYPKGPTAETGIVRHFPQHRDHMHVRFACAPSDRYCSSPEGAPVPAHASERGIDGELGVSLSTQPVENRKPAVEEPSERAMPHESPTSP